MSWLIANVLVQLHLLQEARPTSNKRGISNKIEPSRDGNKAATHPEVKGAPLRATR